MAKQELEILLKAKNLTEEAFRAVERATEQLEGKAKKHQTGFDGMRSSVNSFFKDNETSFSALGQFMGLLGAGVATVGSAVVALGVRGSTVIGVKNSFDTLARSVGDTGDAILSVTRTATKGLISDMDVMSAVNKGILLGLPLTSKEMGTLASTAIVLGKAMQRGPTDALNDLITGLGRGSPLILDNLGITLDSARAYEKYGASVGKAGKDLTDAEKKIALYREATSAAALKVAELGGINLTFADRVTQGKVALGNLVDGMSMAVATSPAINRAMEVIGGSVIGAFGGNSQKAVSMLGDYVNRFAIFLVSAAKVAIEGASRIVQVWDLVKVVLQGVMVGVTALAEGTVIGLGAIVSAASKIPVIGEKFKGLGDSINDQRTFLRGFREDFQAQIGETIDGAAKHKAAFDSMSKGLGFLQGEMAKAVTSGKEYTAGAEDQTKATTAAGAAATTTSKALTQWREKAAELDNVLKTAIRNQAPLTVVTEQYGSAIAEVVRGAQVMGTAVPAAVAKMAQAIGAAKVKEALDEIRVYTAKLSNEMIEQARKAERSKADATTEALGAAYAAEREYQEKRIEAAEWGVAGRLAAIERERREALIKLGEPPLGMEAQWRKSTNQINGYFNEMTDRAVDQSGAVADAFGGVARSIAGQIGGIFGSVLDGAANLVDGLVQASEDKFAGLAGFLNSRIGQTVVAGLQIGAAGFQGGYGAGQSGGRGRGMISGALNGAMGGLGTGAMIGAAGGPIGMVGGAVIGGLAGVLGGFLGGGSKNKAEKAEAAAEAQKLQEQLGKMFGSLEGLQSAAAEFGVDLRRAFSTQKPEEVAAIIDRLNAGLEAKQARLEGISILYDGLGKRAEVFAVQAFGQIEAIGLEHEKQIEAATKAGAGDAELARLRQQHALETAEAVKASAEGQLGAYQRLGMFASATIASQIRETGDLVGALGAAEGTLALLAKAEQTFGFEAEGAFGKFMQMREGIALNRDVYDGLSASTQMMQGFGQANAMSRELFQAFGADVGAQLLTLEGRHADMNLAMSAAQPILQKLWEGQKQFGTVTDETTARILAQAEEQGLVGPQMKEVNQQILDVLIGIKDMLAGGITGAFAAAQGAGVTAAGAIGGAFAGARSAVGGFADYAVGELGRVREAADFEVGFDYNGGGGESQGYSTGTMGVHGRWWENFGAGRPTIQHGQTAIVHPDQTAGFVADHLDYGKLAAAMGGGGGAPSVVVQIGSRTIEDFIVKTSNEGSTNGRIKTARRSIGDR